MLEEDHINFMFHCYKVVTYITAIVVRFRQWLLFLILTCGFLFILPANFGLATAGPVPTPLDRTVFYSLNCIILIQKLYLEQSSIHSNTHCPISSTNCIIRAAQYYDITMVSWYCSWYRLGIDIDNYNISAYLMSISLCIYVFKL